MPGTKGNRIKAGFFRVAKALTSRKKLDSFVSKAAFHPPEVSYSFIETDHPHETNVKLKKNDLSLALQSRGLRARGRLVDAGEQHGKIPLVYIAPGSQPLSSCSKVLLFSHGTSADIGSSLNLAYRILARIFEPSDSCGIVLWDYPGYGLSSVRTPSEQGMKASILKVHECLTNYYDVAPEKLVLLGRSIGSVPTTHLASHWQSHPVNSVILISPIASAYHVYSHVSPLDHSEDPVGALSNISTLKGHGFPWPCIVFHGEDDTFVPVEHGVAILNILRNNASSEVIDCAAKVALDRLEQRGPPRSGSSEQDLLWPSFSSLSDLEHTGLTLYESCESLVDKNALYREGCAICKVPGAGHNTIMDSDVLYETMRATMV